MKYTLLTRAKIVTITTLLSLATMVFPICVQAQISTQLQIILNDEACLQLINQIKTLQDSLEKTLASEFNRSGQIEMTIKRHVIKVCSFTELRKINAAQGAVIKVLLALCDASSEFIEEILEKNQAHNAIIQSLREKALYACNKIKQMISGMATEKPILSGNATNTASLEKCYNIIGKDLTHLINLVPSIVVNNIPVSLQEIDSNLHPYTIQFSKLFKKALAQHLNDKDITVLTALVDSSAYGKLKQNIPQIIQLVSGSVSPAAKSEAESLLMDSWNQTRGTLVDFLQKLKSSNN